MEQVENVARRRLLRGRFKSQPIEKHLRLPWVISEEAFSQLCTRCDKCIDVCETKVLKKDKQGLPFVDFNTAECTFCGECEKSCEQPLFIDNEQRKTRKAWQAGITINNKCLAKNHIYCQSCRDVCEPRAISFSYSNGAIPTPEINESDCTLCGACVSSCPQPAIKIEELIHEPS